MIKSVSIKNYLKYLLKILCLACYISVFISPPVWADKQKGHFKIIVSANWLKQQLLINDKKLKVIDVRAESVFAKGHIPGAINFPVEKSFDGSRIMSLRDFRVLMRKLGINNSDDLILYDDGYIRNAAHVFWVLETYGHEHVAVLDGGVLAWQQQDGKLSKLNVNFSSSVYVPSMSISYLATKLGTRLAIDNPNVTIIDSRTNQEYYGNDTRAARAGHIPNAINFYAAENIDSSSGTPGLRSQQELQLLYSAVDKTNQVMTYCNRGKDSAMTYFVMRYLNYKVSVYDGGWLEWGNDLRLPIEK